MKELNELVELAKLANVAGQGSPEMVDFRVTANPDNIIAIAEAFRELEQRAEAAEAKLAELEKQEPYGYVVITGTGAKKFSTRHPRLRVTNEPPVAVFTQPAPAADLAELVPPRLEEKDGDYQNLRDEKRGYNACIDTILRKIEESK